MEIILNKIIYAENKHRFYKLLIQPDMWGGVSLVREYGRISHTGTVKLDWHETEACAQSNLKKLTQIKLTRGYHYAK